MELDPFRMRDVLTEPCTICKNAYCAGAPRFRGICKYACVAGAVTFGKLSSQERGNAQVAAMNDQFINAKEKTMSESKYIIWNPSSRTPPTVTHSSRPDAIRIAGRMAHENPGETFFVCKLVHKASKPVAPTVTYEDLDK